eukprot:TRINITY_DN3104_c0_g1_i1.p1 TRINITY_DN3104_c0_g1~~TRINITY_DN3104_c0_g1_i1.p1  ORF type:complete len:727 (-),score=161.56 TRINITY_DN3104_c0_g1_i1:376-2556(-)
MEKDKAQYDVIVIGGGMSGLSTAFRIAEQKKTVLVLEASDSFGGRTRSVELGVGGGEKEKKLKVSYGGTWSMIDDVLTLGLADAADSRLFKPSVATESTTVEQFILMATHPYLLFKLWIIGARLYEDNPYDYWRHPHAKEYDSINLEQWLNNNQTWLDKLRDNPFYTFYNSKTTVHDWLLLLENQPMQLNQISTLWAAVMVYLRLSHWTKGGFIPPRILRWAGGTGTFIDALVKKIESFPGCKFQLSANVTKIDQSKKNLVTVHAGKQKYTSSYVVVATGITSSSQISYEPKSLPKGVKALTKGLVSWDDPAINLIYIFRKTSGWKDGFNYLPKGKNAPDINSGKIWGAVMELSEKAIVPGFEDTTTFGVLRILVDKQRTKGMSQEVMFNRGLEYLIGTVFDSVFVTDMKKIVSNHKQTLAVRHLIDWKTISSIPAVTYYWKPGFLTEKATLSNDIALGGVSGRKLDTEDVIVNGDYLKAIFGRVHFGGSERSIRGLHWIEGAVRRGAEVAGEILVDMKVIPDLEKYMLVLEEQGTNAAGYYSNSFLNWKNSKEVKDNKDTLLKELGIKGDLDIEAMSPPLNEMANTNVTVNAKIEVDSKETKNMELKNEEYKEEELWVQLKGDKAMSYPEFCHYARRAYAKREQRIKKEQRECKNPECAKYLPFRGHPPTLQLLKEGVPSSPRSCRKTEVEVKDEASNGHHPSSTSSKSPETKAKNKKNKKKSEV